MSDETIFGGGDESNTDSDSSKRMPLLTNDSEGAAAWLNTDKNGDAYLSISLPLGLGNLQLFPRDDEIKEVLNQMHAHLKDS